MGRLDDEALTAMTVLLKGGHTQSAVARLLGVTEGSVRYHRRRRESGATDGRSRQVSAASAHADAIAHWRDQQTDGRINRKRCEGTVLPFRCPEGEISGRETDGGADPWTMMSGLMAGAEPGMTAGRIVASR
jgi:hypothetical protein